jgi:hypothetical protein
LFLFRRLANHYQGDSEPEDYGFLSTPGFCAIRSP